MAREKLGLLEVPRHGNISNTLYFGQYLFKACFISLIVLHLSLEEQTSFLVINSPEWFVPYLGEAFWYDTKW